MDRPTIGAKCRSLTAAYAAFGISVRNPRTAWSAQGSDGRVVLALWANLFDAHRRVYVDDAPDYDRWKTTAGNKRRLEHLQYVLDHNDGRFDSIIVTRGEKSINSIAEREIGPPMRLVSFSPRTGRFQAERMQE
jgi:hypothetical protein